MSSESINAGLLSDIEILDLLVQEDDGDCLFISPLVDTAEQLGPSSLDLRLGSDIKVPIPSELTHIDLTEDAVTAEGKLRRYIRSRRVGSDDIFVLHPGEFMLASTLEFIRLPWNIAARLEGRSSLGRIGLQIHSTAGFIDPGFYGTLTLELTNVGRLPVMLRAGARVAQLCFFRITPVQRPYNLRKQSKYLGQLEAGATKFYKERDR